MAGFREVGKRFTRLRTKKNYWQQAITRREKAGIAVKAASVSVITGWLYYRSLWSLLFIWPVGLWMFRNLESEKIAQKKSQFLMQFKEMTESMASALNVGYSVENAVREAQKEMRIIYSEKSHVDKELTIMVRQIRLQIPLEQVWDELAERVGLEDVQNFASVFSAAKRSGGDMLAIIQNTVHQIGDKVDVKREIDTILAAKRYEFQVMCMIPYAMIAYMQLSFPEFMSCLYGNAVGIGVMTVCLSIYAGAYALGAKLIKIEV